jgi:phosphocarrier protein HPr
MLNETVIISNSAGIHARPAATLVKAAAKFDSDIVLTKDGLEVNGKSIMGVMMLAAEKGSSIQIQIDGADEQTAMKTILELFAQGFGES